MMDRNDIAIVLVGIILAINVLLAILGILGWYPSRNSEPPSWIPGELRRKHRARKDSK
jgi:hypothetical protein